MADSIKIDTNKLMKSFETVNSIETCISTHNFHDYFFEMEDYIDSINLKHGKCINGYQDRIYEIIESIDKIKNKVNLLTDSLRKTIDNINVAEGNSQTKVNENNEVQLRNNLEPIQNNDSSTVIVPLPTPSLEETKNDGLFPEGYNTTPIGLGIAAAGVTGAIGAIVIDSSIPKSAKKKKTSYEIDNEGTNEYIDYEIADEAEEKPIVSLKIDPSMTSYQAIRNHENMKKFYAEDKED